MNPKNEITEKYYNASQASKKLGMPVRTVQVNCLKGVFKTAFKCPCSKHWLILQQEIDLLIPSHNTNINKETILKKEWI